MTVKAKLPQLFYNPEKNLREFFKPLPSRMLWTSRPLLLAPSYCLCETAQPLKLSSFDFADILKL